MKLLLRLAVALCAGALLLAAAPARAAQGPVELLQQWLHDTRGGRADFVQTVVDDKGHAGARSSGSFEFERPGRFRWTYASPARQDIVSDGQTLWIFDADLQQVTISPQAHALSATPAALLSGADVERLFALTALPDADGLRWVQAQPRSHDASFDWVRIGLREGPQGPEVEQMQLRDAFRRTSTIVFSAVQRNPSFARGRFHFDPPPGAAVIRQP